MAVIGGGQLRAISKLFSRLGSELQSLLAMIASCPEEDPEAVEVVHKQFELKASAFSPKPKLRVEIADGKVSSAER